MINLEEFYTLSPGDQVKIVDKWPKTHDYRGNPISEWLGKVMTIKYGLRGDAVRMVEDEGERTFAEESNYSGWFWYEGMIDEIVDDAVETLGPLSMDEIALLYA